MSRLAVAPLPAWIAAALSLALATLLYVSAVTLGYDAGATPGFLAAMIGAVGLVALVVAVALGVRPAVGLAVVLLLAGWMMILVGGGAGLRVDFVLAGAGLFVVAEVAHWSIEQRADKADAAAPVLAARAGELGVLIVVTVLGAWGLVELAARGPGGLLLDLVAVAAVLALGVVVLRRSTLG